MQCTFRAHLVISLRLDVVPTVDLLCLLAVEPGPLPGRLLRSLRTLMPSSDPENTLPATAALHSKFNRMGVDSFCMLPSRVRYGIWTRAL